MNYIKRSQRGVMVSTEGEIVEYEVGLKSFINKLCMDRLASYDGILKATKTVFKYHKLIPILVRKDILLFSTQSIRNLNVILINYYQIKEVKMDVHCIEILFYDRTSLKLDIGQTMIKTQIKRCSAINDFLTKKTLESVYNYGLSIEI